MESYESKRRRLAEQMRASAGSVRLGKSTSNLFRDRAAPTGRLLNVRDFNQVIRVDPHAGWVDAEGMTPYEGLVEATLSEGVMPAVVPELKTITLGGAAAGVGIESSAFRYGLVHENLLELDILLGDGEVVTCTPENEHRDLFFGFPNSYGTLGYALRVRTRTIPVKPYVELTHIRFDQAEDLFGAVQRYCDGADADFLDGTVFAPDEVYLTLGCFRDEAPAVSDYTYERIYYRSIRERATDWLTTRDYIWRWDTDWFWCSKNLGAQNPLLRRLLGRSRLNSRTYTRWMRWNAHWGLTRRLNALVGIHTESLIQDVDIPIGQAAEFLAFFHREIGIRPIWICPIRVGPWGRQFVLYPMEPGALYINFGFWDRVRTSVGLPGNHFNRLVERKVLELGGIKSLYSDSYFTREELWNAYGGAAYQRLKERYDPDRRLRDLYQKCVLKA